MSKSTPEIVFENIARNKWRFAASFLVIFFLTLLVLAIVGFVPSYVDESYRQSRPATDESIAHAANDTASRVAEGIAPVRVVIPEIGVDAEIVNPTSTEISVLDQALLDGAVRYPGSGLLEENANMFLFGHSSYLRNVRNDAYKTFNGIQKLEPGDVISVYSSEKEYRYRVASVKEVAASEAWVDLSGDRKRLTLSTCDSFGNPDDRFVVEADFVGSYPFAS